MDNCVYFVATKSGDMVNTSGACFGCWSILMSKAYALPAADKTACATDPTADKCTQSLIADLVSFVGCSGMHPIMVDFEYARSLELTTAGKSAAPPASFLTIWTMTAAALILTMF